LTHKFVLGGEIMVKIRLKRVGAKKAPFYKIVVADSRFPRDGRSVEEIGTYDPMKEPSVINIDKEKIEQWIKNGAQPTDTVKSLMKRAGIN
jgi:small subunit ribosomal protein S16